VELPDPERAWERPAALSYIDAAEVERRIGRFTGPVEILGGGQANLNVRVEGRVLRIYRRDRDAIAVEAALLARRWSSFRVPAVLDRGEDFLLLEDVPHTRLAADEEAGMAVGRALSEIHADARPTAGLLDGELRVREPFDLLPALREHMAQQLRGSDLRDPILEVFDAHEPALRPHAARATLLHGDFKPANLHRAADSALLVLDWEFAYAGSPLLDLGQLFRWDPPPAFATGFERAYPGLPAGWRSLASVLDLVNLAGLLARPSGPRRRRDVRQRILATLRASRKNHT
jgi:hypothetical protein